ncbi:MAG TPA: nuclear transport factor 2 family protein [Ilumatobacteraceae bacterium]|mgnify:CR=1 FL=1|nr:nuclear transport factor 2 family protein [Ilumatobacteraceae bacterium]
MAATAPTETDDYVALTRVIAAYADAVNRRAWADFDPIFQPDTTIVVDTLNNGLFTFTGGQEIGAFIDQQIAQFEFFEFVVLNAHYELYPGGDKDSAKARIFMCELRQDAASGMWTNAFGLYQDVYRRGTDGRWRFAERHYQSLARTGRNPVFPLPTIR